MIITYLKRNAGRDKMKMNYKGFNVEIQDDLIQELKETTGEDAVEIINKVLDVEYLRGKLLKETDPDERDELLNQIEILEECDEITTSEKHSR
jgi:hypothetical protein